MYVHGFVCVCVYLCVSVCITQHLTKNVRISFVWRNCLRLLFSILALIAAIDAHEFVAIAAEVIRIHAARGTVGQTGEAPESAPR